MTWGSTTSINGDGSGCLQCRHIEACRKRQQARDGLLMLCEDSGRSYLKHSARLLEHLSQTDGLTAGELAKALGIGRSVVSQWCIRGCAKGDVAIIGSKLNKGVPARIYAVVSPGDAMTADELKWTRAGRGRGVPGREDGMTSRNGGTR